MTWPAHTYDWFAGLEQNNSKEWFQANGPAYAEIELASQRFLEDLASEGGGEVKVFRLRRDPRFSKGAPPYKTEQRAGIKRPDGTVLWFDLGAGGITVAAGHPAWDARQLARARAALVDPSAATELATALDDVIAAGFVVDEPELKNPIKGLHPDHPRPELTRHKHLAVARSHERPAWLLETGAGPTIRSQWTAADSLTGWLSIHVGATSPDG